MEMLFLKEYVLYQSPVPISGVNFTSIRVLKSAEQPFENI